MERPQRIAMIVRALIFYQEHLLLVRWTEPVMPPVQFFPVGGRVERGETVLEALHREVLEETGCRIVSYRLLYTHENSFTVGGEAHHEYGSYFLVETDRPVLELGSVMPCPDHPALELTYLPVLALEEIEGFYPEFLRRLVPEDYLASFPSPVRHVVSRNANGRRLHELFRGAEAGSPVLARWFTD